MTAKRTRETAQQRMIRAIYALVPGIAMNPGRIVRKLAAVGIKVTWNEKERRLE